MRKFPRIAKKLISPHSKFFFFLGTVVFYYALVSPLIESSFFLQRIRVYRAEKIPGRRDRERLFVAAQSRAASARSPGAAVSVVVGCGRRGVGPNERRRRNRQAQKFLLPEQISIVVSCLKTGRFFFFRKDKIERIASYNFFILLFDLTIFSDLYILLFFFLDVQHKTLAYWSVLSRMRHDNV